MANEIIGYKALNENLQAFNGFQYEIGKTYETDNCRVTSQGFHFVYKLENIFENACIVKDKIRIVKIKATGYIDNRLYLMGEGILCTNRIEILEEISKDDIEKYINELNLNNLKLYTRKSLAEYNYRLDELVYDSSPDVRKAVAKQGYRLDILINDEKEIVGYNAFSYISKNDPELMKSIAELISQKYNKEK